MYVPLLVAQFVHMISNDGGEVDINKIDYSIKMTALKVMKLHQFITVNHYHYHIDHSNIKATKSQMT